MAQGFCIPKNIAEKLKDAVRNKEWDMKTLWEMSSKQRNELFAKYVDDATAVRINSGFERAMQSQQGNALRSWAESVFVGKDELQTKLKKVQKKDIIDKIKELNEIGFIKVTPNAKGGMDINEEGEIFLDALVEETMGVTITKEEMKSIADKVKQLEEWEDKFDEFGLPVNEYWAMRKDIEDHLLSFVPSNELQIATSTIGRGSMLLSLKSPLLNIESNTIMTGIEQMNKRITRLLTGRSVSVPSEIKSYQSAYRKRATEIMSKYGYDVTRIFNLAFGKKRLGEYQEIHSQGKGVVRKVGRFYEDVVFGKLLSLPDVFFASTAFADSAGLWAMEVATRDEGLQGTQAEARAMEIIKDATKIQPNTMEGFKVREKAIADAQHATFTDDTRYSEIGLGIRAVLNTASGDLRLGDQLMPFVKTPANVIGVGLDMAGWGALKGVYQLPKAIEMAKTGDKTQIDEAVRNMVYTGLGWTFAYILLASLDPDDFMGAFPTNQKERDLMFLKNATPNSFKLGDKWISADYFGGLANPMLGIMYARKYKGDWIGKVFEYAKGNLAMLGKFPGIEEAGSIVETITQGDMKQYDPEKFRNGLLSSTVDFIRARTIPGLINDLSKMSDEWERDTDVKKDPFARLKATIPGLRQTLDIKENVYGEKLKTESEMSILLFGSRFKTASQSKIIDEVIRLARTGNAPSVTNSEYTSPRVKSMKEWLSKKEYDEFIDYYQKQWVDESLRVIGSDQYKSMADDEKGKELTKVKESALEDALERYYYDYLKQRN